MFNLKKTHTTVTTLLIILIFSAGLTFAQKNPGPPPPPPPMPPKLFNKQAENQFLKSINNMLKEKLFNIKKYDRKTYERLLQKSYFNSMDFPFFNSFDKKRQEIKNKISTLDIETNSLALSYKNDSNVDKSKIKEKLRNKLNELFDLKELTKKQDVERLEKRLKTLKHSLAVRSKNKDEIIKRRLNQLIGEEKYMDWNE